VAKDSGAFLIGCVPITWNQFRRVSPDEWTNERVLREVALAGYEGVAAGPRDGQTAAEALAYYADFGLRPAPGYLGGEWWDADKRDDLIEKTRRHAAWAAAVGVDTLFVAPNGGGYVSRASGKKRGDLAGQVGPNDGLTDDEYARMADCLNEAGRAALSEGVRICFHNHVGLAVETPEETERVLSLTDPNSVFLGLDTGHLAWAGGDVTDFARRHAPRLASLHLKDIHYAVRDMGVQGGWNYGGFTDHGVFAELGEGDIDFPALLQILRDANFRGWLLAETDVTQKATALESATISRSYLRSLGL